MTWKTMSQEEVLTKGKWSSRQSCLLVADRMNGLWISHDSAWRIPWTPRRIIITFITSYRFIQAEHIWMYGILLNSCERVDKMEKLCKQLRIKWTNQALVSRKWSESDHWAWKMMLSLATLLMSSSSTTACKLYFRIAPILTFMKWAT